MSYFYFIFELDVNKILGLIITISEIQEGTKKLYKRVLNNLKLI